MNKEHRVVLHRLWELENRIESGELVDRNSYLDYLLAAKGVPWLTDKEIEFFAKHNARVRGNADAEIARLTAERDDYKSRAEVAESELERYKRALYNISRRYELMLGFSENEIDLLELTEVRISAELDVADKEIEEERKND